MESRRVRRRREESGAWFAAAVVDVNATLPYPYERELTAIVLGQGKKAHAKPSEAQSPRLLHEAKQISQEKKKS